jgi:hypothetical protein
MHTDLCTSNDEFWNETGTMDTVCEGCSGEYTTDTSDAVDQSIYCSADCEHETECASDSQCENPDVHTPDTDN